MGQTLSWLGESLRLLDQTKLPLQTVYLDITDEKQAWDAIRRLVVRGAPAIGVAAAFGAYLGIQNAAENVVHARLDEVCDYLATSRPTAVNLFWALDRIRRVGHAADDDTVKHVVLDECKAMLEEDKSICRMIGEHGAALLRSTLSKPELNILTHCNAGALATVAYGTALAPIYVGMEQGMRFHVYADETRPLLQGSRITAYELKQNNVPVTVLCDNMAAALMSAGRIDAVIVGTDRVTANGDVANKIGTLGVAIIANHFNVPFFVAAPISSIDVATTDGGAIPIEHRDAREVSHAFGIQTAPDGIGIFNPAFDVTPADLVTAIITERGVLLAPYKSAIHIATKVALPLDVAAESLK